jgi:hypothetical protein
MTFDLENLHVRELFESDNHRKIKSYMLGITFSIVAIFYKTLLGGSISRPLSSIHH